MSKRRGLEVCHGRIKKKNFSVIIFMIESERKKVKVLSRVRLFATPWSVAYHAPPSMGFSRQEHWSGLPFTSPKDLPNPGRDRTRVSGIVGRRFIV